MLTRTGWCALAEKYLFGGCVVVRGRQKYFILGCVMCGVGHNLIFFGGCGLNPGLYGILNNSDVL